MEVINPPCNVNEIISHLFNYENLQKYLEYLLHLDKRAVEQIYQMRLKIEEFADLKQDISDLKFKLDLNEKKFEEVNTVLSNHQIKLIEVEKQASGFNNVKTFCYFFRKLKIWKKKPQKIRKNSL